MLMNVWTLPNTSTDYFLFEILRWSPLCMFSSITLLKGCKRNNFLNKISKSEAIKSMTLIIFQIFTQKGNTDKDEMSLGLFLCWQLRLPSSSLLLYWKPSWLRALTFHKQSFQRLTGYLEGARSVQGLLFFFFFWSCHQGASRQIQKEQWGKRR